MGQIDPSRDVAGFDFTGVKLRFAIDHAMLRFVT